MSDTVKFFVLPGCRAPERAKPGDAGWDLFLRAIVGVEMSESVSFMHRTVFDFKTPPAKKDYGLACPLHIRTLTVPKNPEYPLSYELPRDTAVLVGFGVVAEIPYGYAGYIEPRGSSIHDPANPWARLEIANDTVPIDSGFRGEFCAILVNHGHTPFTLYWGRRFAQLVVKKIATESEVVDVHHMLSKTVRANNSHGSTGK